MNTQQFKRISSTVPRQSTVLALAFACSGVLACVCAGKSLAADVQRLTVVNAQPEGAQTKICCLSGVDTQNGSSLILVSDRGTLFEGDLDLDQSTLTITQSTSLMLSDGTPMPHHRGDAEGLAIDQNGHRFISFEGVHRVAQYEENRGITSWPTPDFVPLKKNGGLEALAIDAGGTLWALSETPRDNSFALLTLRDGLWITRGFLPGEGDYLPVGADFDDSGRLYVLERDYSLIIFRTRVRRINTPTEAGFEVETLWESKFGEYDNLEGIAVLPSHGEKTTLILVSDDNQMLFQNTEVLKLTLD